MYGTMAISGAEKTATYNVIVDEPDGKPAHLYVDANGNGDLTDDGDALWTGKEVGKTDDGKSLQQYSGGRDGEPWDQGQAVRGAHCDVPVRQERSGDARH